MPKRQEVSVFSYIFFSGRHSPLPIAGACRTVLFVEPAICIVAEYPGAFLQILNFLQSASSSLMLGACGIFEINNLIQTSLKSLRPNLNVIARTINVTNKLCRWVVAFGNISHLTAATDPGIRNPRPIQVELPIFQLSDGVNECAITSQ
jgi:hypothetical protein